MRTKIVISLVCALNLVLQAGCEVDAEDVQEAITDSFSPDITLPFYQPSLTRISEIRPVDTPDGESGTRFIYETDAYYMGANIKFIWHPKLCDNAFTYIDWSDEAAIRSTYTGSVTGDFDPYRQEDLEAFMAASGKWIYSYGMRGELEKVRREDDPDTFRSFSYNTTRDFYDSIVEYREGVHRKTLQYQYAADQWELISILELGPSYDTLAIYSFEFEARKHQETRFKDPVYKNHLIGIPNAPCTFMYLYGPLWAWHFPLPVKRLFKDGILVYEASFEYDIPYSYETPVAYPTRVNYSRMDDTGGMALFSEEILTEFIQQEMP